MDLEYLKSLQKHLRLLRKVESWEKQNWVFQIINWEETLSDKNKSIQILSLERNLFSLMTMTNINMILFKKSLSIKNNLWVIMIWNQETRDLLQNSKRNSWNKIFSKLEINLKNVKVRNEVSTFLKNVSKLKTLSKGIENANFLKTKPRKIWTRMNPTRKVFLNKVHQLFLQLSRSQVQKADRCLNEN